LGCDDFKGARKRLETDLGRFMLVTDGDNGLLLLAWKRPELKAIPDQARVARIGVKHIDGPVLSELPVVTPATLCSKGMATRKPLSCWGLRSLEPKEHISGH
jgi:hypothetical protein